MVTNRFFFVIFFAGITLLSGCAVPFQNQAGGFAGVARDPASGSMLAFGGSGNTGQPNQRMGTVQVQHLHPSVIVNNLDPELCMGGYIHNGRGWTCPGGQIIPGTQQHRRASHPQNTESVVIPAKCDFSNGVVAYSYEGQAGCDKLAARMSRQVSAPSSVEKKKLPSCVINTGQNEYRFNKVGGQMIDGPQCQRYLNKLDPLPKETDMALVQ